MVGVVNFPVNISDQKKLAILAMTREYTELGLIKEMLIDKNKVCIYVPNLSLFDKITAELEKLK